MNLSKSNLFNPSKSAHKIPLTTFFFLLNILFLSSIRPTGAIFSIIVILIIGVRIFTKSFNNLLSISRAEKLIIYSVFSFCLAFCFYQLKINSYYLNYTVDAFISEGGTFFGIERQLLREKISALAIVDSDYLKSYFYRAIWKIMDFVAGMSDIRDSYNANGFNLLFPFFSRVFVGIFIIYPMNLLAFFGIFIYWKRIYKSGLWICLIAALICLAPSLIGVALTRYLFMVYPPLIIISAKTFGLITNEFNNQTSSD